MSFALENPPLSVAGLTRPAGRHGDPQWERALAAAWWEGPLPLAPPAPQPLPAVPEASPAHLPDLTPASGHEPGPRVHVEQDSQGLRIWLGLDGAHHEVNARAVALVGELRRELSGQPQRLASIVCNGATVYALAPPALRTERKES
ncbi:MAG TPA: hypothetical protein VLK85_09875 [Ramlibacter sp.]|nr:hypothetical protein [Ramlibacter sp.]